jgi:hypothetical protein
MEMLRRLVLGESDCFGSNLGRKMLMDKLEV